jgi:hypothetical protein
MLDPNFNYKSISPPNFTPEEIRDIVDHERARGQAQVSQTEGTNQRM